MIVIGIVGRRKHSVAVFELFSLVINYQLSVIVLLAHCEYPGLNSLQVTRLPISWLYSAATR